LAEASQARATLLHVSTHVPSMYTGLSEMEETLPQLLSSDTTVAQHLRSGAKTLAQHSVEAKLELRHGVVAEEILLQAREGDYDLIVLGATGAAGRLRAWLLGNITWRIIDQALRPIIVVK
jgi:nucleotide-binding universal stress UspA family protein